MISTFPRQYNELIRLCAEAHEAEMCIDFQKANALLDLADQRAFDAFGKMIIAHYRARTQTTFGDKLHWDEQALKLAAESGYTDGLPSLYLNVADGHLQSGNPKAASFFLAMARESSCFLNEDGYGKMIRRGILHAEKTLSARETHCS